MFTDGMKELSQEVIELKDESISPDVLKIILDSIYTGDLLVNEESVSKVLTAADHLQLAGTVHQCCNFLLTEFVNIRLDFETYCRIWEIAFSYGLKDLQDAADCNVAKSVIQWVNYKKEERMAVAAEVIGGVRQGLVDIGVVIDDLNTEEMQQIPEIYKQVHEAAIYKHRPTCKP